MSALPPIYRTNNLTFSSKTAIFCGLQGENKMSGDCRVKRRIKSEKRQSPPIWFTRKAERAANIGHILPVYTAPLPQSPSPYRFGRA